MKNSKEMVDIGNVAGCEKVYNGVIIPTTFEEAMNTPEKENWLEAINSELESLRENNTYSKCSVDIVPEGKKVVGTRWVFDLKTEEEKLLALKQDGL